MITYPIARNSEDKIIEIETITEQKRKEKYFCPRCGNNMIPKMGKIKEWHFAHKMKCPHYWEPESKEHKFMKKTVLKLLKENPTITFSDEEVRLPNKENTLLVADVYFEIKYQDMKTKKFAIECQVSELNYEKYKKKDNTYLSLDIIPFWIFLENSNNKLTETILKEDKIFYKFKNCKILKNYFKSVFRKVFSEHTEYPETKTEEIAETEEIKECRAGIERLKKRLEEKKERYRANNWSSWKAILDNKKTEDYIRSRERVLGELISKQKLRIKTRKIVFIKEELKEITEFFQEEIKSISPTFDESINKPVLF